MQNLMNNWYIHITLHLCAYQKCDTLNCYVCMVHVNVTPHDHIYSLVKFRSFSWLIITVKICNVSHNWGDYSTLSHTPVLSYTTVKAGCFMNTWEFSWHPYSVYNTLSEYSNTWGCLWTPYKWSNHFYVYERRISFCIPKPTIKASNWKIGYR